MYLDVMGSRRDEKNIPYTTQYPCRGEEVRMMRVEHADHQQDGGEVRWAAFLKTRTEDRTSIQDRKKDFSLETRVLNRV